MSALPPPMHDRDGKIWMDGELVAWRDAKIHVLSHTLHYGCGAFEGLRAYDTA
ncbi:MAG: branched chain amino acid aminotransferase, partial [Betaproteobacteria bacterium]|nr:branched chain amino acid aminotransferase [Betaproteobacteria bacterium]